MEENVIVNQIDGIIVNMTLDERGNIKTIDNDRFYDLFKYKPLELKNKFIGKICINDHLLGKTLLLEKILQKEEISDLRISMLTREGKIKNIISDLSFEKKGESGPEEVRFTIKELLSKSDKRTFFRKRTNVGLKIIQENNEFFAHCINISIGGMLVEFNHQIDLTKEVSAKFYPTRLEEEFILDCNPVWINSKKSSDVLNSIAGLKFINLNNELLEKIYSFIIEV